MPINPTKYIWFNGELVPWEKATVHVMTHALHYGSSVFEGERVYATHRGPAYFRLADHTRRLFESAKVYEIEIGYSEAQINAACIELIRANQMGSAYVRPIVFRGAGGLGVLPKGEAPVDVAIMALDWGAYLGDAAEHGANHQGDGCNFGDSAAACIQTMMIHGGLRNRLPRPRRLYRN